MKEKVEALCHNRLLVESVRLAHTHLQSKLCVFGASIARINSCDIQHCSLFCIVRCWTL